MKIRKLVVRDYRAFGGEHTFHFSERFTVIAGVNGRGKTAILDGLALLISRLLRSLKLSAGDRRTIELQDIHTNTEAGFAELFIEANCADIPVEFMFSRYEHESRHVSTRLTPAVIRAITHAYGDSSRPDDQSPIAAYYTIDRAGFRLPRTLPKDLPHGQRAAYTGALVNRIIDYRDFMARYRLWQADGNRRALKSFRHALGVFLDGFGDIEITNDPLRLKVRKGDQWLQLDQLSDGERSFIAILGDLVRRLVLANPELDNPLKGHGVVLIDEIELHLHPTWQREVCEKLRSTFPNIQFIATTHSPFVIQSLRSGELINLDPEEFGEYADKSIEDIAETVMGIDLPQKSSRYMRMMEAAEEYFRLLRDPTTQQQNLDTLEQHLNELAAPFSDDPAFQAFLKLERETHHGGGGDATS